LIILIIVGVLSFFVGYKSLGNVLPEILAENVKAQENSPKPANANAEEGGFFQLVLSSAEGSNPEMMAQDTLNTFLRFLMAVVLSGILAFRPRKNAPFFKRNLYVAQTQILLAVVAAALMMIVGDNTARAFAIFAAVSLVRFRTNIKDPKEITVLLISLALGLAAGVGRWELGLALCFFVLMLLWFLEYNESDQICRPMELSIETKNTDRTQDILKHLFKKNALEAEVRAINPPEDENSAGSVVYFLNLRLNVSTDRLSDQILTLDSENIESVKWKQQKNLANAF
jgi:uncharacterized membrane protein YhiD involved in acid resistance